MTKTIKIPFNPRPQQAHIASLNCRFIVLVCHRRFGKTVLAINLLIRDALRTKLDDFRGGYIAPLYKQAKFIAWDYLKKYTRVVPGIKVNESELTVIFPNGSKIRLFGADNPDSLRGLYFDGVVLDEPAQMSGKLWDEVLRPTLADRKGWAMFIGTPQGRNKFYNVYQYAKTSEDPDWLALMHRASETGIIDKKELDSIYREMTADAYEQEFECSFTAAIRGAYYAALMSDADKQGRITGVPFEPKLTVNTVWDLGMRDDTSIIFYQQTKGGEIRIIDYYEANGEGLEHYANVLQEKHDTYRYSYNRHFAPHDISVRELGTGKSRLEVAKSLGISFTVAPNLSIQDGINASRSILPKCWFDKKKTGNLTEALIHYKRDFNDKMDVFKEKPLHDWSSHAADAFRYLAITLPDTTRLRGVKRSTEYVT